MTFVFTDEVVRVLLAVEERELEIATRPAPMGSRSARERYADALFEEERENGPRYSPTQWFGDGDPLAEAERVRFLRAIWKLALEDYLAVTTVGGKLRHLKLTPKAKEFLASADGEETA